MDYIKMNGNENDIIAALSDYMSEGGAKLMLHNLHQFANILIDDESYKKEESNETDALGLIIPKTNYYINLKMTTLALIGLLLDIRFKNSLSSFTLKVFGVKADSIRKLTNTEKCILLMVKSKSIFVKDNEYIWIDSPKCINCAIECEQRQYDRCAITKKDLNEGIEKLKDENIISQKGNVLVYHF